MDIDGSNAWRKLGVLTAICLIATLGEFRGSGSDALASTTAPGVIATTATTSPDAMSQTPGTTQLIGADADGPSGESTAIQTKEDAHLVPAIYAWDPDVRFVYFRHVSKWM